MVGAAIYLQVSKWLVASFAAATRRQCGNILLTMMMMMMIRLMDNRRVRAYKFLSARWFKVVVIKLLAVERVRVIVVCDKNTATTLCFISAAATFSGKQVGVG